MALPLPYTKLQLESLKLLAIQIANDGTAVDELAGRYIQFLDGKRPTFQNLDGTMRAITRTEFETVIESKIRALVLEITSLAAQAGTV